MRKSLLLIVSLFFLISSLGWAVDYKPGRLFDQKTIAEFNSELVQGTVQVRSDVVRFFYIMRDHNQERAVIDGIFGKLYDRIVPESFQFSPDGSRTVYLAQQNGKFLVVLDGIESKTYDAIRKETICFSPDSNHLTYVAKIGEKWATVSDGAPGKLYDEIAGNSLHFSADGKHLVYAARLNETWVPVIDQKEGNAYDGLRNILYSPDSARLAYIVRKENAFQVIVDGVESPVYDMIKSSSLCFSPDSKQVGYIAQNGTEYFVVINGNLYGPYSAIGETGIVFSPDGRRFAFAAQKEGKWFINGTGVEEKHYDAILANSTLFSPDGKNLAYGAAQDGKCFVVLNGQEQKWYDAVQDESLTFSPDSRRLAYVARKAEWSFVVDNQSESRYYQQIVGNSIAYSPDSMHLTYLVERSGKRFLVLDNQEGRQYDAVLADSNGVAYYEGNLAFRYLAIQGSKLCLVNERLLGNKLGKKIVFRFDPPDTSCVQTITNSQVIESNMTPSQTVSSESKLGMSIRKTPSGYTVTSQIISLSAPSEETKQYEGITFAYELDSKGRLLNVKGLNDFITRLKSNLPANLPPEYNQYFSEESYVKQIKSQWENRVQYWLEREFVIGETYQGVEEFILPDGSNGSFESQTRIIEELNYKNRTCVKVLKKMVLDQQSMSVFLKNMMKTFVGLDMKPVITMEAEEESIVELNTLLAQFSQVSMVIKMSMDIPGKGALNMVIRQKMMMDYQYE